MDSKYFAPPALLKNKYSTWKKEMQIWELVTFFNILLPEPVLTFRALKSANLAPDNEKLVKATVSELTLSSMSGQSRKIMHKHSSDDSSPNTSPVVVKNEMDIINYAENTQMDPTEVYYGRSSYRGDSHFNNWRGKINCGGR